MSKPITIEDEIAELYREWRMRRRNYPKWVAQGTLSQRDADWQMAVLMSIATRLKHIAETHPGAPEQLVLMGGPDE